MEEKLNKPQGSMLLKEENKRLKELIVRLEFQLNAVSSQIREFYPMVDGILWELGELD